MALVDRNRNQLQKAVDAFIGWTDANELQVKEQKTELVVFRKGRRTAQTDEIYFREVQ